MNAELVITQQHYGPNVTLEQVNDIVLNGMMETLCPQICQTPKTPEEELSMQMVWQ
eukprot:CAMPEP_0184320548 /NCGR_PEP_ID=MMETSP1049-20130417/114423_1 /TAXON_ID=77928 /ORGANISM="Proteomonas sulcata, Strain CCMP704" /LENGTH=55 /DNA_ID=CAMNT_0026641079 /DNA_START=11 /DNA_END=175 /DNA_ORIENTATION=-